MASQMPNMIETVLQPKGVGGVIKGAHQSMSTHGENKAGFTIVTSALPKSFPQESAWVPFDPGISSTERNRNNYKRE
ncbi:MAG: GTP cyclohydrolase I [Alphaproteobacteria bacterium]|nr:GTP cyclohydrolase I [Alphaproteobacteria bacterium]